MQRNKTSATKGLAMHLSSTEHRKPLWNFSCRYVDLSDRQLSFNVSICRLHKDSITNGQIICEFIEQLKNNLGSTSNLYTIPAITMIKNASISDAYVNCLRIYQFASA